MLKGRGDIYSKFIFGVDGVFAYRSGIVEFLYIVGFIKVEREEEVEVFGSMFIVDIEFDLISCRLGRFIIINVSLVEFLW